MTLPAFKSADGMTAKTVQKLKEVEDALIAHTVNTPVHSDELEINLGLKGTQIRAAVSFFRVIGKPIGSTEDGYFWAEDPEELESTIAHIRARMVRLRRVELGLLMAQDVLRQRKEHGAEFVQSEITFEFGAGCPEGLGTEYIEE